MKIDTIILILSAFIGFSKAYSISEGIPSLHNVGLRTYLGNYSANLKKADFNEKSDQKCQEHLTEFIHKLTTEQWALQMADASGKLSSGIAKGNLNSLGSFDECLSINHVNPSANISIQGKYCLASISLLSLKNLINQITIKPRTDIDPSTLLPSYRIGICLPASCSASSLENFVSNLIETQLKISNFSIDIEESTCYTEDSSPWTAGDWIVIGFFTLAILVIIASTLYDLWFVFYLEHDDKQKNQILVSFSLYTNTLKLCKISNPGKLSCLHGIRVLSIFWVILGHRFLLTSIVAPENLLDYQNWLQSLSATFVTSATFAVDTFFLLSGFLLSYIFFEKYEKGKSFNIFFFYLHRYLRITPAFAVLILFYATLFKHTGNGPLWYMGNAMSQICVDKWWSNLLYVQNYVNPKSICIPHGWYLAVDMQLYIISPLLIVPLIWKPRVGIIWTTLCILVSILVVVILDIKNDWKADMVSEFQTTIIDYYYATHTRATPWLIGFISGYIIVKSRKTIKMNKLVLIIGWLSSLLIMAAVILGVKSVDSDVENVSYMSLSKPVWALAVLWIIVTCYYGYGGPVNWFLSLGIFQILARLSYSIYLVHFTVQMITSFSQKTTITFYIPLIVHTYIGDIGVSIILAYFLCIMFESPISNLEKKIFKEGKNRKVELQNKSQSDVDLVQEKFYEKF